MRKEEAMDLYEAGEMSAVEAALRLGLSRERVIRLIQIGRLTGRRDAALGWRVDRQAVESAMRPVDV